MTVSYTHLYERLSRDDDLTGDSNSILNQKRYLESYAAQRGYTNIVHYTDDGLSLIHISQSGMGMGGMGMGAGMPSGDMSGGRPQGGPGGF